MCLGETKCSFGIYKKGDASEGAGDGNAEQRLVSWAQSHTEAGRKVEWCGFWRDNAWDSLPTGTLVPFPMDCSWKEKDAFNFGYMAVFNWEQTDEPDHL